LIKELDVYEWVVFGNGLDFCVDNAVKSLLRTGYKVTFLEDVMISSATGYGNSGTVESRKATYKNWIEMGAVMQTFERFLQSYEI
jgi:nicotinamidase-related amidase